MNTRLLHKYLSGECNTHEKRVIESWLNSDARNQEYLNALEQIWDVSPGKKIEVDALAAWKKVRSRNFEKPGMALSGIQPIGRRRQKILFPVSTVGRKGRILASTFAAAAVILITFMFTQHVSMEEVAPQLEPEMQEITTARGQRTTLRLLDGTQVYLNVDSRISIPGDFNESVRQIYLEGEAYFEVESDPEKPFLVHTADGVTEVLGTEFDVRAYPNEKKVQVMVAEGKVLFGPEEQGTDQKLQLTRNRQGTLSSNGEMVVSDIPDLDEHIGWKAGKLTFHGASLEEVKHHLERWYDINITLQNEFPSLSRRLTASFENEPLTEVLNVIALALEVEYKREGREVIIFPG